MEIPLSQTLNTERRDYFSRTTDLVREREQAIERIREDFRSSATKLLIQQERLKCLRKFVELRVKVREEYGRNDPRLFSKDQIDRLVSEIRQMIDGTAVLRDPSGPLVDQRLREELQAMEARARAALDKLVLQHSKSGAAISVNSVVSEIHARVQVLQQAGQTQLAEAVKKLTDAVRDSKDLDEIRGEILQTLAFLAQHAALPADQRQSGLARVIYLGLSAVLARAQDVAQIWALSGPQIATFFGFAH